MKDGILTHALRRGRYCLLDFFAKSKNPSMRRLYWELRAEEIHQRWGFGRDDYSVLQHLLRSIRPHTLLDVGCGSGRCFPLYQHTKVPEVVGQDISSRALIICQKRFPNLPFRFFCGAISDLPYDENYFDLTISTRTLSAVPPAVIEETITFLCRISRYLYVNEVTDSDYVGPTAYWFKHDFNSLVPRHGFLIDQTGTIHVTEDGRNSRQTWVLYRKDPA
jgi:ubiquinone/menaquinone biosynthesis C-methylase UbiE